ncbi:unnamed protein product [Blepharisma stoltei]|uniref:Uncharacterized protein n=1 Tax=Blepharisma stoltei TaxID=1481888 RepID=A0AAU9J9K6_9CILI|nr:unnamed protein product [Blepharisma stoltei]
MKPYIQLYKKKRNSDIQQLPDRCASSTIKALLNEGRNLYRKHHRLFSQGCTALSTNETPDLPSEDLQIPHLRVEFPKKFLNNESTQIDEYFHHEDPYESEDSEFTNQLLRKWANPTVYKEERKSHNFSERQTPVSLFDVSFDRPRTYKFHMNKTIMPKNVLRGKLYKGKIKEIGKKGGNLKKIDDLRVKSPKFFKDALEKVDKISKRHESMNPWTRVAGWRLKSSSVYVN